VTDHPFPGLFQVHYEKTFEGGQHKACVSQMVRVRGVHNDAYTEKTSGCNTKLHDVTRAGCCESNALDFSSGGAKLEFRPKLLLP
jgi:hypothetical protein